MHAYIHTCMHTYIHTRHTHIHTYMHACMHTYMRAYIHTYIHTSIHVHTCTYMYIHVHTCTYMYIHVHTCTFMYIHVHTQTVFVNDFECTLLCHLWDLTLVKNIFCSLGCSFDFFKILSILPADNYDAGRSDSWTSHQSSSHRDRRCQYKLNFTLESLDVTKHGFS